MRAERAAETPANMDVMLIRWEPADGGPCHAVGKGR
jgi:hypothetical protein